MEIRYETTFDDLLAFNAYHLAHSSAARRSHLIDRGEHGETKTRWEAIERVGQDEQRYYLYNSSICAFIVPKSAFANESVEGIFLETVGERASSPHPRPS